MNTHRYGCRICEAVHESPSMTVYPETIRVVRKVVFNKDGSLKSVESEYECWAHSEPL